MAASKKILYSKGASLAVHGSDGSPFWICKLAQDVKKGKKSFRACWYEEENPKEWSLSSSCDTVPLASVIHQLRLKRLKGKVFTMSDVEFKRTIGVMDSGESKKTKGSKGKGKIGKVSSKVKKVKIPKIKVDKSNPNWRLKPREHVTEYSIDPFFDSKNMDFPFISTSHYSRLLIRSILLKDKKLLQSLINDSKRVSHLNIRRSLADSRGPNIFAILQGDKEALKMLFSKDIHKKPRAPHPIQLIETISTGTYNFKSLGIRHIRRIEASRGGREGNNALTKDDTEPDNDLVEYILSSKVSKDVLHFLLKEEILYVSNLLSSLSTAFYENNVEIALHLLKKYSKDYGFTNLHIEALSAKDWSQGTKGMKEASVVKKGAQSITPLHLAAMNPNVEVFKSLFSVAPDLWVEDVNKRTPVHYAAASLKGMEVMKFLDSKFVSWELPDKNGYTPLAIATRIANLPAMEFILSKDNQDEDALVSKHGVGGIDRPLKNTYCPIHLAAMLGKVDSMKVLLKHGVKVEKPLSAKEGRLTALMIGAAYDHLDIVRLLVEKGRAKVEALDKFKRTALTHAVMNGATRVASYLLRLGANPDRCDSSGNSNLHYACAYGWYHCVLLLLESSVQPDPLNEWKISPCAIAFLRGHRGLGEYMLKIPGVSGNFQDSKGLTLLLHLLKTPPNETSCKELYAYLVYLLNDLSIDPLASDIENKNAFHYLAKHMDYNLRNNKATEDKSMNTLLQIFDILHKQGCNPCQMDNFGNFPVDYLLTSNLTEVNHELITEFIDIMNTDISKVKLIKDKNISIMAHFISNLRLQDMKEMKKIGCKIVDLYKQLECHSFVNMDKYRKENKDLLFNFCRIYSNFSPISNEKLKNFSEHMYNNLWIEARDFLSYFLKYFKPCLRERIESKEQSGEKSAHEIMLAAGNEPKVKEDDPTFKAGFEVLFSFDSDLEVVSNDGTTCLSRSIISNNLFDFRQFMAKGANIFVTHKEPKPLYYEELFKTEGEFVYRDPLIDSIFVGNLEMFETLMKAGAACPPQRLPDYPIFIAAVNQVLQNRNDVDRIKILKKVMENGKFLGSITVSGCNALHLCVENSTDDFNINLEIESHLLKSGVSPIHKDDFGRIPLHYAFIKDIIGKNDPKKREFVPGGGNGLCVIDPIEVVSMLVDGMNKSFVDSVDMNGSSPLHYACFRGSTVCTMLLIEKGANINRKDSFGNTPLAYAIMGRHEATAITLLQKDADANCQVFSNSFLYSSLADEDTHAKEVVNSKFKFLPSHFKAKERSQFPFTLFEMSLQNGWLGVSYLILDRMEKYGMRFADAVEVAFKLQKFQLAKKLLLKQISDKRQCELVSNQMNLISSLMKHPPRNQFEDHVIDFIVGHLIRAGNDMQLKDNSGCTSLHYASLSNIPKLLHLLLSYPEGEDMINDLDINRRAPLAAILWNCVSESAVECANILFSHGADPNILCHFKKFDYFHKDFHPSTLNILYEDRFTDPSLMELTTPLIIAVNFQCKPLIDLILRNGADPNMTDGSGRTPLMAAVKSNDVEFVKYFVDTSKVSGGASKNEFSPPPSKKKKDSHLLINAKDNQGFNIMHHSLFMNKLWDGAHDNKAMMKFLLSIGGDPLDKSKEMKLSATDVAEKMKLPLVYQLLAKKSLPAIDGIQNRISSPPDFPYDVQSDAEAMFTILSKNICSSQKNEDDKMAVDDENDNISLSSEAGSNSTSDVDWEDDENDNISLSSEAGSNFTSDVDSEDEENSLEDKNKSNSMPTGLSLTSGNLVKDYTTLLSKIMVQASYWGMYNFYRMQIWKDSQKDLFVLFTNWGRWGDHGNYQNTPFGSVEQAIQEFEKIYKSKTGNDWSKRTEFQPKINKYRQLDIASFVKRPRPKINFNLKSDVPSKLPVPIQTSIKHISNVTMYAKAYESLTIDSHVIPFGQLNKPDILNALELLKGIQKLLQEKDALSDLEDEESKNRLHTVLEEIQNKSNEYFYLMPVRETANTMITPIHNKYSLQEELRMTSYLLDFEFAERVLLGAQYRKKEINPLDYIYYCLSVQMTPLTPQDEMSDIIMKYIYNSNGAKNRHSVDAIFKITKDNNSHESPSLQKEHPESTPRLLWHGTKCINLLSILNNGLIVDPPYSDRSGETFGKGIYTADVYDKSFNYCDQNKSYTYILLCQAKLGKIYNPQNSCFDEEESNKNHKYDSIKISGRYEPLDRDELHLSQGVSLPLGKILRPSDECRHINYNEFILKKSSQISTDYLIRIKVE